MKCVRLAGQRSEWSHGRRPPPRDGTDLNRIIIIFAPVRHQAAVRQSQAPNSAAGTRADMIKDEFEDASMKVEQCRVSGTSIVPENIQSILIIQ